LDVGDTENVKVKDAKNSGLGDVQKMLIQKVIEGSRYLGIKSSTLDVECLRCLWDIMNIVES
jgi:hypothetical protein